MHNILICDDERDIVSALKIYLTAEGYGTFEAYTGAEALDVLAHEDIQLVLMDIMMPGLDGIAATAKLRESLNIPVILLTAKSEDTDKILGLNIGADDYVTKPFNPVELMARVRAQLRRFTRFGGLPKPHGNNSLSVDGIELDDSAKTVTKDGDPIQLTPTEYNILKLFMQAPGRVFSMAQIYEAVWGGSPMGAEGTVAVHIRHLREKIELDPSDPRHLKVVWGKGYKLERGR
jgi:Response regulators consisting of a CheY-like receiver domain and a winged-helix DNA-binding domain